MALRSARTLGYCRVRQQFECGGSLLQRIECNTRGASSSTWVAGGSLQSRRARGRRSHSPCCAPRGTRASVRAGTVEPPSPWTHNCLHRSSLLRRSWDLRLLACRGNLYRYKSGCKLLKLDSNTRSNLHRISGWSNALDCHCSSMEEARQAVSGLKLGGLEST